MDDDGAEISPPPDDERAEWVGGRFVTPVIQPERHDVLRFASELAAWAGPSGYVGLDWRFHLKPPGGPRRPLVARVAYVRTDRWRALSSAERAAPRIAPDVAVVEVAWRTRPEDVAERVRVYAACGCPLVIVMECPPRRIARASADGSYDPTAGPHFLDPALPGFSFVIDDARPRERSGAGFIRGSIVPPYAPASDDADALGERYRNVVRASDRNESVKRNHRLSEARGAIAAELARRGRLDVLERLADDADPHVARVAALALANADYARAVRHFADIVDREGARRLDLVMLLRGGKSPGVFAPDPEPYESSRATILTLPGLAQSLRDAGVDEASTARIVDLARPAVRFDADPAPHGVPLGASRMGGAPDLPGDFVWPVQIVDDAFSLAFLAQIDLATIDAQACGLALPARGWLYVFYDGGLESWGFRKEDRAGWHVAYYDGERSALAPRALPDDVMEDGRYPCYALTPHPSVTLPDVRARAMREALRDVAPDALDRLYDIEDFYSGDPQMGGSVATVQNPDLEAVCAAMTTFGDAAYGRNRETDADVHAFAVAAEAEWQLLLHVGPETFGTLIPDGAIYVLIRRSDLARRDFSNVWCMFQCG